MKFKNFITGSEGNCSLVQYKNTKILIDCGFPTKKLLNEKIGEENIDAIFISHEHMDHLSNWTGRYAMEKEIPVFLHSSHVTKDKARKDPYLDNKNGKVLTQNVEAGQVLAFQDLKIELFDLEHCSSSNFTNTVKVKTFGFLINDTFGYVTDTGMITNNVKNKMKQVKTMAIEFNYDEESLIRGNRYFHNKVRSYENMGHLSNQESYKFCKYLKEHGKLEKIIIMHMSNGFNSKELVENITSSLGLEVIIADREEGTGLIEL